MELKGAEKRRAETIVRNMDFQRQIGLISGTSKNNSFVKTSKDDFNDIAQAKSSKSKGDETQTKKQNAEQCHATRFSE